VYFFLKKKKTELDYYNEAVALKKSSKYYEAISMCNKAIEIKSDYASAYNIKAICLFNLE